MEYTFTLKYQLGPDEGDMHAVVERLAESGCDDALVGIGLPGRIALAFTREAKDARAAVYSALEDVRRGIPSAVLIEIGPDLAGLTDIAGIVGVSRQNMRKLMLAHAASFPPPLHEGTTSLWHLVDVLSWLQSKAGYRIDPSMLELAHVTMQVNAVREGRRVPRGLSRELLARIG